MFSTDVVLDIAKVYLMICQRKKNLSERVGWMAEGMSVGDVCVCGGAQALTSQGQACVFLLSNKRFKPQEW